MGNWNEDEKEPDTNFGEHDLTQEVPEEFIIAGIAYTSEDDNDDGPGVIISGGDNYYSSWDAASYRSDGLEAPAFVDVLEEMIEEHEFTPTPEQKLAIANALIVLASKRIAQGEEEISFYKKDIEKGKAWLEEAQLAVGTTGNLEQQLSEIYND